MSTDWSTHWRRVINRIGKEVNYTTPAGVPLADPIRGIFRRPYERALNFVESSNPSVICMSADVPEIGQGATFVILGTTYTVREPKADPVAGTVMAELETAGV